LARLYDPAEGRVTVGGSNLREFDPARWRARVGVIFQDYLRYQLTVGENIGFGRAEAMDDKSLIVPLEQKLCDRSALDDEINPDSRQDQRGYRIEPKISRPANLSDSSRIV
jgi:ABC-type multidrug transport system fused ATPase/permease subunit